MKSLVSTGENVWQKRHGFKKILPVLQELSEQPERPVQTALPALPTTKPFEEILNIQLPTTSKSHADSDPQLDKVTNFDQILSIQIKKEQVKDISDLTKTQEMKPETEPKQDLESPPYENEFLFLQEKLDQINLSLPCKKKVIAIVKDEKNCMLLKRMTIWLSSNKEKALKVFENVMINKCLTYKSFVGAMIDLDSPFRVLELYALVIMLSTLKASLISLEDILKCLPPKKLLVCNICGFGKTTPVETPKAPLSAFQKLLKFPEMKAPTTKNQWTEVFSKEHTKKPDTKFRFKAVLKKKASQDNKHDGPTTSVARAPKLFFTKKSSFSTSQSKMKPPTVNHFKGLKQASFSESSEKLKEKGFNKEAIGISATNWQFARKRTLNVRMSKVGKLMEQVMPLRPTVKRISSVDEENQTGMTRLTKRTTSEPLLKRVSSIKKWDFKSKKTDKNIFGKKIFGKLIDMGEEAQREKNIFDKAAAKDESNTNNTTSLPKTSTNETKPEETKTPSKKNEIAFLMLRKMDSDEKVNSMKIQPYLTERYILVQLRYIVYNEIVSCSLHFSILLTNTTQVSYMAHYIKENIDISCKEIYISPNRLRLRQSLLRPDYTLKQCSYRGYCKAHPQKITLFYDFDVPENSAFITSLNP